MRVMIVEDHQAMRRILRSIVEERTGSDSVTECMSGEEAVDKFAHVHPDLVLMDVQLGGMNGMAAARHILGDHPNARIVFVTSFATPEFRRRAETLHVLGVVSKDRLSDLHQYLRN